VGERRALVLKKHKLALQSAALIVALVMPALLYWAALAASTVGLVAGLAVLAAAMTLAAVVS
jgi:hypothetical protein